MSRTVTTLDHARGYDTAGIRLFPIARNGTKAPAVKWKEGLRLDQRPATTDELIAWFGGKHPYGIGALCGACSGGRSATTSSTAGR